MLFRSAGELRGLNYNDIQVGGFTSFNQQLSHVFITSKSTLTLPNQKTIKVYIVSWWVQLANDSRKNESLSIDVSSNFSSKSLEWRLKIECLEPKNLGLKHSKKSKKFLLLRNKKAMTSSIGVSIDKEYLFSYEY